MNATEKKLDYLFEKYETNFTCTNDFLNRAFHFETLSTLEDEHSFSFGHFQRRVLSLSEVFQYNAKALIAKQIEHKSTFSIAKNPSKKYARKHRSSTIPPQYFEKIDHTQKKKQTCTKVDFENMRRLRDRHGLNVVVNPVRTFHKCAPGRLPVTEYLNEKHDTFEWENSQNIEEELKEETVYIFCSDKEYFLAFVVSIKDHQVQIKLVVEDSTTLTSDLYVVSDEILNYNKYKIKIFPADVTKIDATKYKISQYVTDFLTERNNKGNEAVSQPESSQFFSQFCSQTQNSRVDYIEQNYASQRHSPRPPSRRRAHLVRATRSKGTFKS